MAVSLFTGNVIAVIWDFGQTLIPGYQQGPLFRAYDVDESRFWEEVDALGAFHRKTGLAVSQEMLYLNHFLTYVKAGLLSGLNNARLRDFSAELSFYAGMPEFMALAKKEIESIPEFISHEITVEHYIVSTGLRQIILGSAAAAHAKDVWASEFIETPAPPGYLDDGVQTRIQDGTEISQVGYFVDNTVKTRAIWEINKGVNVDDRIGVMTTSNRRIVGFHFATCSMLPTAPPTSRCSPSSTRTASAPWACTTPTRTAISAK